MKFIIQFVAIIILAYFLELFLPWYSIAIAGFTMGFLLKSKSNFWAGFLAIALLWFFAALIIESNAAGDLAERVALIFPLKHKLLLMLVASVLGGLVGGMAALTGSALRRERRLY